MNPIGMHYGFWSHNWDEIAYIPLMEKLAWLGFDICEVASAEWAITRRQAAELKACADHNGLGITYSIGLEAKYDLASDDPAVRENGIRHVTRILESMPQGGGDHPQPACPTPGGRPCPTTESPWMRSAARRSLPWSPCPGS